MTVLDKIHEINEKGVDVLFTSIAKRGTVRCRLVLYFELEKFTTEHVVHLDQIRDQLRISLDDLCVMVLSQTYDKLSAFLLKENGISWDESRLSWVDDKEGKVLFRPKDLRE